MSFYNVLIFAIFVNYQSLAVGYDSRNLTFTINPGCEDEGGTDCDKPWLIHGQGISKRNTIHYLWSAVELPSFIMLTTNNSTVMSINWTDLQNGVPGAIQFEPKPVNAFGVSFQTLILFNDTHDTGTIDDVPESSKKYISLSEFEWVVKNETNALYFQTTKFRGKPLNDETKIVMKVTSYSNSGRSSTLPHLLFTPDSSQLEISLDHLILDLNNTLVRYQYEKFHQSGGVSPVSWFTHPHQLREGVPIGGVTQPRQLRERAVPIGGFTQPRWALDMIFISSDISDNQTEFIYESLRSLDDEYTPGVFTLNSVASHKARIPSSGSDSGGYMQWKPVCYLTPEREITSSTYPNINTTFPNIDADHWEASKESLIYVMFGNASSKFLNAQTTVSFGLSGDGFYTEHNYTQWTFAFGLGYVPEEKFSSLVIIAICVGAGLPATLFIIGCVYLGIRKFKRRDELLING